jgi:hypothetical protein
LPALAPFGWMLVFACLPLAAVLGLAVLVLLVKRRWKAPRKRLGLDELARRLGITPEQLQAFRPSYRRARIPKRTGGVRQLLIPDPPTMQLQRRVLRRLLARLRAHPAATAYERGRSIVDHARPHVRRPIVITFDIVDFFASTRSDRVRRFFLDRGWDEPSATWLMELCCADGGLPQGAPTSPRLSNLLNRPLDAAIIRRAAAIGARYTRYSDDIALSVPYDRRRAVLRLKERVKRCLKGFGYRLHPGKLKVCRAHRSQRITGLVVNDGVRLPRDRRRLLRAMEHRQRTRGRCSLTPAQLAGWRSHAAMVARLAAERPQDP